MKSKLTLLLTATTLIPNLALAHAGKDAGGHLHPEFLLLLLVALGLGASLKIFLSRK